MQCCVSVSEWMDFRIRLWSVCGSVALIALKSSNYSPGNTLTHTNSTLLLVCERVFLHPGSFSQTIQQQNRVSHNKDKKETNTQRQNSPPVFLTGCRWMFLKQNIFKMTLK